MFIDRAYVLSSTGKNFLAPTVNEILLSTQGTFGLSAFLPFGFVNIMMLGMRLHLGMYQATMSLQIVVLGPAAIWLLPCQNCLNHQSYNLSHSESEVR